MAISRAIESLRRIYSDISPSSGGKPALVHPTVATRPQLHQLRRSSCTTMRRTQSDISPASYRARHNVSMPDLLHFHGCAKTLSAAALAEVDVEEPLKHGNCLMDQESQLLEDCVPQSTMSSTAGAIAEGTIAEGYLQLSNVTSPQAAVAEELSIPSTDSARPQTCPQNSRHDDKDQPVHIFLGGTCADSTWRTKQAIPIIAQANCTYFNPQLPEGAWTPEAIPVENQAKANAVCLLFVITPESRGIASMVEAAELIAAGRQLVLCMADYSTQDVEAGSDVNRGRKYLRDVADRYGCTVYHNVEEATSAVVRIVALRRSKI